MPWYKIEFNSGPGHQSNYVEYEYTDHVLDNDEEHSMFEQHSWMYDNAIGNVQIVTKLPVGIRNNFISDYKLNLQHAAEMLNILWKTPTT